MVGFWDGKKKGLAVNCFASPIFYRIWGKNLVLVPNSFPQKGGEKVLKQSYKTKIKRKLMLY